jgi:hypothetical protein
MRTPTAALPDLSTEIRSEVRSRATSRFGLTPTRGHPRAAPAGLSGGGPATGKPTRRRAPGLGPAAGGDLARRERTIIDGDLVDAAREGRSQDPVGPNEHAACSVADVEGSPPPKPE